MAEPTIVDSQPLSGEPTIVSSQDLAPKTFGDQVKDAASEFANTIGGTVRGAASLLTSEGRHQTAADWQHGNEQLDQAAADAFKSGDYPTAAAHAFNRIVNTVVPGFGASMDSSARDFANGDIGKGMGRLLALGTVIHAPDAVPAIVKGAASAAANLPKVPPMATDIAGAVSPKIGFALRGYNRGIDLLQRVKTVADNARAPQGTPAGDAASTQAPPAANAPEPPMSPLQSMERYFTDRLAGDGGMVPPPFEGARGESPQPLESPEGKQPVAMPSSGLRVIQGGKAAPGAKAEVTVIPASQPQLSAAEYKAAAQLDKSTKVGKFLADHGFDAKEVADGLSKMTPAEQDTFWKQAADGASTYHGEKINAPGSMKSRAETLFHLQRLAPAPKPPAFANAMK